MFIPHLAHILKPLYRLVGKGIRWDWDETCASAFITAKQLVKAMQALNVIDPSRPCELDIHVTEDRYGRVSGSGLNELTNPLDSGHNSGKGQRYDTL